MVTELLSERLHAVVELMSATKESWVESEPENTDLAIYVHFWRDQEMVAAVICPLDRDTGLDVVFLGSRGYSADMVSMTYESWHSSQPISPVTGRPWKPQEMQYVGETMPEQVEKGVVNECLTTSIHARTGEYGLYSRSFRVNGKEVEWGELVQEIFSGNEEEMSAEGHIFSVMKQAIEAPRFDIPEAAALVPDEETRLFHYDAATTRLIRDRELAIAVMLHAPPGSARQKLIEEQLGTDGFQVFGGSD